MAPRKKTEEKASANEAADMVLHYLRKSLTVQCFNVVIRYKLTHLRQAEPSVLGN
jgi:hypothetical protein